MAHFKCFVGSRIVAKVINDPSNAFNVESNAHDHFNQLAWGVEARQQAGGEVSNLVFS
jgi:hypothetical protein